METLPVEIVLLCFYPIVFALSVSGNTLVLITVFRNAAMRTITNLFIANLAVSDILMSLINLPLTPLHSYVPDFVLPLALCKMFQFTIVVSVYVPTMTSTAIAIDRYLVIVHPFVRRMSKRTCGLIIALVWVTASIISSPMALVQQKHIDPETNTTQCIEKSSNGYSKQVYSITNLILQFVLPCVVICCCYYRVSRVLHHRCSQKIGSGQKNREKEYSDIKRKRRTNKMLIAMVVTFVISWIPLNILLNVTDATDGRIQSHAYYGMGYLICHLTAMCSAMYNPFLYAWLNSNFRNEFRSLLPCRVSQCKNPDGAIEGDYAAGCDEYTKQLETTHDKKIREMIKPKRLHEGDGVNELPLQPTPLKLPVPRHNSFFSTGESLVSIKGVSVNFQASNVSPQTQNNDLNNACHNSPEYNQSEEGDLKGISRKDSLQSVEEDSEIRGQEADLILHLHMVSKC